MTSTPLPVPPPLSTSPIEFKLPRVGRSVDIDELLEEIEKLHRDLHQAEMLRSIQTFELRRALDRIAFLSNRCCHLEIMIGIRREREEL